MLKEQNPSQWNTALMLLNYFQKQKNNLQYYLYPKLPGLTLLP